MKMTKKLAILTILVQISALAAFGETKEGWFHLKPARGFATDAFTTHVGDKITGTCKFYIQDFLGKKIINANIQIVNTSSKAMHCQYYVAFFDDAGKLIGCAGQGTFGKFFRPGNPRSLELSDSVACRSFREGGSIQDRLLRVGQGDWEGPTPRCRGGAEPRRRPQPAAVADDDATPQEVRWYCLGPAWKELMKVAKDRGVFWISGAIMTRRATRTHCRIRGPTR